MSILWFNKKSCFLKVNKEPNQFHVVAMTCTLLKTIGAEIKLISLMVIMHQKPEEDGISEAYAKLHAN